MSRNRLTQDIISDWFERLDKHKDIPKTAADAIKKLDTEGKLSKATHLSTLLQNLTSENADASKETQNK